MEILARGEYRNINEHEVPLELLRFVGLGLYNGVWTPADIKEGTIILPNGTLTYFPTAFGKVIIECISLSNPE